MLSVLIPAYDEEQTVGIVVRAVLDISASVEVIVVDDGSRDATASATQLVIESLSEADAERVVFLRHEANKGKGAAVRTALSKATGEVVVIQDADLETDPRDLVPMLELFERDSVQMVYGSRWLNPKAPTAMCSRLGAWVMNSVANLLFGARLTDVPTAYKMMRKDVAQSLGLSTSGFAICAEITAKLLSRRVPIVEIPIGYEPRGYAEGKKIRPWHVLSGVWTLVRVRCQRMRAATRGRSETTRRSGARADAVLVTEDQFLRPEGEHAQRSSFQVCLFRPGGSTNQGNELLVLPTEGFREPGKKG